MILNWEAWKVVLRNHMRAGHTTKHMLCVSGDGREIKRLTTESRDVWFSREGLGMVRM